MDALDFFLALTTILLIGWVLGEWVTRLLAPSVFDELFAGEAEKVMLQCSHVWSM